MANGLVGDAIGCDAATRSQRLSAAPEVNSSAAAAVGVGWGGGGQLKRKKRRKKNKQTKNRAASTLPFEGEIAAAAAAVFFFCFALKFIGWIRFVYREAFDPAGVGDEEANQGGRGWAKTVNPT